MKILLVGDYPNDPRLGSAKVPHKLADEFRLLGHTCDLLFTEQLGTQRLSSRSRHLFAPYFAERSIARAFATRGPYDVVDIASGEGVLFGLFRRAGAYKNVIFVSRSHGLEHLNYARMIADHREGLLHKPWYRRLWFPLVRLNQVSASARLADKLILLNSADEAFALSRGWKHRCDIRVIGHGIPAQYLEQSAASSERGAGILFCGTWTGMKGVDYLVKAFTIVATRNSTVKLTILGGHVPREQILQAFPPWAAERVRIIERCPEQEVMNQYRAHDVLAFCSTYEGFGMVVPEAMSQRLPVVGTKVGCVPSLIVHGVNGWIVPPRDPQALADGLLTLLADSDLRRRMAAAAYQSVSERTWSKVAKETLALYDSARPHSRTPAKGSIN